MTTFNIAPMSAARKGGWGLSPGRLVAWSFRRFGLRRGIGDGAGCPAPVIPKSVRSASGSTHPTPGPCNSHCGSRPLRHSGIGEADIRNLAKRADTRADRVGWLRVEVPGLAVLARNDGRSLARVASRPGSAFGEASHSTLRRDEAFGRKQAARQFVIESEAVAGHEAGVVCARPNRSGRNHGANRLCAEAVEPSALCSRV